MCTRPPGSSLYTLATEPPQVVASAQVSASSQVAPPCLCHLLSHQTLLWHHRLGLPSLPCLRGMHSRLLVSGLAMSLPPLPPSHAPPCLPCVEGRQRAAPHSSSFPPTTAPLQTLHMDVWGPGRVSGQGRERYFLLVVDDYTRTPRSSPYVAKIRGGGFSSDLVRDFCHGEGILQSFTLPDSPQQNGIAECRIGLVMEVARTSMIHADAPHFLWPFAGPAPSDVSQVDPLPGTAPVEVAVDSGAARGAVSGGATSRGAEPGGAESEGAGPGGAKPGGAEPTGVDPGGADPGGVVPGDAESEGAESGGAGQRGRASSGVAGARESAAGDTRAGGAGVLAGAGGNGGATGAGPGCAHTRGLELPGLVVLGSWSWRTYGAWSCWGWRTGGVGAGAGGTRVGGAGAGGAGAVDSGAGGNVRPRPYFVPLLQQVLGVPSSTVLTPPLLCPPHDQSQPPLQPASSLPTPSPYTE
ncbi:unnamed protein product [Closterium sp. NIES-54]